MGAYNEASGVINYQNVFNGARDFTLGFSVERLSTIFGQDASGNLLSCKVDLKDTGVTAGRYSAVDVDSKGRVTAGGKSIEWGTSGQTTPSGDLMIGGLFMELQ